MTIAEEITRKKIIAISRGIASDRICQVADALLRGKVTLMEVTFSPGDARQSEDTLKSISILKKEFGNEMHIGAGTVLTARQVALAQEAGAEYIISPNTDEEVIRKTKELGLVSIPGAMTPTEAAAAWKYGSDFVKIFPAGNFGPQYIKAMLSSLNHLKLIATGGVDETNLIDFLKSGCTGFGIGGSLVSKKATEAGDFGQIQKQAEKMTAMLLREASEQEG